MTDEPVGRQVDIAFTVQGDTLPRDHRRVLAAAIGQALPWWAAMR